MSLGLYAMTQIMSHSIQSHARTLIMAVQIWITFDWLRCLDCYKHILLSAFLSLVSQIVYRTGDPPDKFYIILTGAVL